MGLSKQGLAAKIFQNPRVVGGPLIQKAGKILEYLRPKERPWNAALRPFYFDMFVQLFFEAIEAIAHSFSVLPDLVFTLLGQGSQESGLAGPVFAHKKSDRRGEIQFCRLMQ